MTTSSQALRYTVSDTGIAEIVLTQAARGNPLDVPLCDALNAVATAAQINPAVRCVLIRAEGRAFSFGGDLSLFKSNLDSVPQKVLEMTGSLHAAISRLQRMNAPIVAAVHGVCAGGMVGFITGSDFIVAADEAATRRLLLSAWDQPLETPLETQLELEAQALAQISAGDDAREGITAFLEKRKPEFVGR